MATDLGPVAAGGIAVIKQIGSVAAKPSTATLPTVATAGQNLPNVSARAAAFQRGINFQTAVLKALGLPENKIRMTVNLPGGGQLTAIPDTIDGATLIEIKDVVNLSISPQFRAYAALKQPIDLIVSSNTQSISKPLQDLIKKSGGSIRVFDETSNTFSVWP